MNMSKYLFICILFGSIGTVAYCSPFYPSLFDQENNYTISQLNNPSNVLSLNVNTAQQWTNFKGHPQQYCLDVEYRPMRQLGILTYISEHNAGFERNISWQAGLNTVIATSEKSHFLGTVVCGGNYDFFDFSTTEVITQYPAYQNAIKNKGYSTFISAGTGFKYENKPFSLFLNAKGQYLLPNKSIEEKMYRINILAEYIQDISIYSNNYRRQNDNILLISATTQYAFCPMFGHKTTMRLGVETYWLGAGIGCGYISRYALTVPEAKLTFFIRKAAMSIDYQISLTAKKLLPGKTIHNVGVSYVLNGKQNKNNP
jgi:hypothetical protein